MSKPVNPADRDEPGAPVPRAPETRAALTSLVVGLTLLAVKFAAYFLTGSAAIFSDAMEGIVNVLASGVALYAVFLAHIPADPEHPYGHGKAEFLSAGFEGGLILLAAIVIAVQAIGEMIEGPGVHQLDAGILLLIGAMLVNGATGWYLVRAGRRTDSATLVADGKHLLSDALTSAAIVLALIVMWFRPHWTWIDPIAALVVALYLIGVGGGLVHGSVGGLMDKQDRADDRLIRSILDAHTGPAGAEPRVCSYHKLRHRHSGRYHWVDFHLVVPADWTVTRGHEVASAIEYEIEQALGVGNATAHVEPCISPACSACRARRTSG